MNIVFLKLLFQARYLCSKNKSAEIGFKLMISLFQRLIKSLVMSRDAGKYALSYDISNVILPYIVF